MEAKLALCSTARLEYAAKLKPLPSGFPSFFTF